MVLVDKLCHFCLVNEDFGVQPKSSPVLSDGAKLWPCPYMTSAVGGM